MNSLFSRSQRFSLLVKGWWNQLKTWLYHIHDFILLLLLSLLTERDELISIAIFLTTGYIGVFLIHKFMQKNNRICNTFSSSNRSFLFILPFLYLAQSYYHYFSLSYMWSDLDIQFKIFRWYCMVCRFSYILCTLSTVVETINVSLASYDYILVNRGQSQTTTITFFFYHYDWLNEYINCSSISFHSTYFWFYNGSSRIRLRLCFNAIN